ncbi:MAG: alpha-galactosidase [Oscillospiraceae bacterium]|nr:alpha-galactosidase [Oscillospiraceae bacterium]
MIRKTENDSGLTFFLGNERLSCLMKIRWGKLQLLHMGAPVLPEDADAMCCSTLFGWGNDVLYSQEDNGSSLDTMPLAWSETGAGDYRESPVEILVDGEPLSGDFVYSYSETADEPAAETSVMPHASGEHETLKIVMRSDNALLDGLRLELYFSLFDTVLVRRTVLVNDSDRSVCVKKLMSACVDLKGDYVMSTFDGGWIRETHRHDVPVSYSRIVNESTNGFSSNRHNPGFLLAARDANEDSGEVFGFNLVWSGNHYSSAQRSAVGFTRVLQGISPEGLCAEMPQGQRFETPDAVIAWSERGYNGLSERMHDFINDCVVPKYWRRRERPVLFNSWEGCMFSFTESKLISLARKAKKLGCELFVLDDGWFGERNDDHAGLGDYNVNRKKLPGGLEGLSRRIHAEGMQFGLWFEPEAVNPDSDCYRAHPDWVLASPGSGELYGRNELLLDLTKSEVRDYIVNSVSAILDATDIQYVKWDMNRCSPVTGEKAYEYILGLYEVLGRIFRPRPQILLEGCASGGNRFDLGMLCFAPQIWASDDTDPIERLNIQTGLSYLYPQSTMGAHISAAPHAMTLRNTPLSTRANVSFFGAFGLEFDLDRMQPVDEAELKDIIAYYKARRKTFQFGCFRRNRAENGAVCWQVSDAERCLCGLFHRLVPAGPELEWLCAELPEKDAVYTVESRPQLLRVRQFGGLLKHILPIELDPEGRVLRTADRHYKMYDGKTEAVCSGRALRAGIPLGKRFSGTGYDKDLRVQGDFGSNLFEIKKQN